MRLTVPSDSDRTYLDIWGEVLFSVECVSMWAATHGSHAERLALRHVYALLLYGQWEAGPLDLEPHPKLLGYCLLPASLPTWQGEWEGMLPWAVEHLPPKLVRCRKILSVLAWHLSMRQHCRKELVRCIRAARLVRQASRSLRSAVRQQVNGSMADRCCPGRFAG
eukprot:s1684_g2.t1